MFVVTNRAVLRREMRRGNLFLFVALLIFATGFFASLTWSQNEIASTYAIAALGLGFVLWLAHKNYLRRYGPRYRQDAVLASALRGLGNRYSLVCFPSARLPDYLLLGPHGVAILVARGVDGKVRCRKDRWSLPGRSLQVTLSRMVGDDPLPDPTRWARMGLERLGEHLRDIPDLGEVSQMPVAALIVFTHPNVQLDVEESTYPVLRAADVAGYLQRQKGSIPAPVVQRLRDLLIPPEVAAEPDKKRATGAGGRSMPPRR